MKSSFLNSLVIFIILIPQFVCADLSHREWIIHILAIAQNQFTLSTTFSYEVENKEEIADEVDLIVVNTLAMYGEELDFRLPCIRLLYIQGNYNLYTDRPVAAQNKLLLAKRLCEEGIAADLLADPIQLFKKLKEQDPKLPSMYSMILQLLGKSYIFPKDPVGSMFQEDGLSLIKQALVWRGMIEENIHEVEDHLDNNIIVGNTHIFKRTLGLALLEQNKLQEALDIFLECCKISDPLNQLICLKNLIKIYQKLSQQITNEHYYKQGLAASVQLLDLLKCQPNIYREATYYCIIGDFFSDLKNPFYDRPIATHCYEVAKKTSHRSLLFLTKWASERLFQFHLNEEENIKAKEAWRIYKENNCHDLAKRPPDMLSMIKMFEQLGECFTEVNNDFYASVFLVNAIALAKKNNFPSLNLEYKNYVLLQKLNPSLSFDDYHSYLFQLKKTLSNLRKESDQIASLQKSQSTQQYFSEKIIELVVKLIKSFIPLSEIHKEDFSIIAGGSLARQTQTLYSDLEIAFLIKENLTQEKRKIIKDLFNYLAIFLTSLEETPLYYIRVIDVPSNKCCKRGFMLDPALIAPVRFSIKTPAELIEEMFNSSQITCLNLTFLNHAFVFGSELLFQKFQSLLKENLTKNLAVILNALKNDLVRWSPKIARNHTGLSFSVKHDLYKPLFTLLDLLFACHGHIGRYTPWKGLDELQNKEIIDKKSCELLKHTINSILYLRQLTYARASCQEEQLHFNSLSSFAKFFQLQRIVVLLQETTKRAIQKKCMENLFINLTFFDSFLLNVRVLSKLARMYLTSYESPLSLKYLQALFQPSFCSVPFKILYKDHYLSKKKIITLFRRNLSHYLTHFDSNHPRRSLCSFLHGYLYQLNSDHVSAINLLEKARENDTKIYGPSHLKMAAYHYRIALSHFLLDDLIRAYFCIQKAYEIHSSVIGKHHGLTRKDLSLIKKIEKSSNVFQNKEKIARLNCSSTEWPRKKYFKIINELFLLDLYDMDKQVKAALERLDLIQASYYFYP